MKQIEELRSAIEESKKLVAEKSKNALREAFAEFFTANPNVAAIRWNQYTPYFNDGDTCTFGVNDFSFKAGGAVTDDDDDGFSEPGWPTKTEAGDAVSAFQKALGVNWRGGDVDSIFEAAFGDHAQVTATRDGFDVSEYEHD